MHIEWRHLEIGGDTCTRCAETGKNLAQVVRDLHKELASRGVEVIFTETTLGPDRIGESNAVLFNGVPLEQILSGVEVSENYCASCSDLTGSEVYCRTVRFKGETHEEVPRLLIREAAYKAAGLK